MITFTFHIIKLNVLSALMICLTMLLGRITRKHYALQWKYWIWLLTALLLLYAASLTTHQQPACKQTLLLPQMFC